MTIRLTTLFLLLGTSLLGACGSTRTLDPSKPTEVVADSQFIRYEAISVNVITSYSSALEVETASKGEAVKEGFKMMAAAPIGCMGAGMFAAICIAAAPFFPIIAAANLQDPDMTQAELKAFNDQITEIELPGTLRKRVLERLEFDGLPVADSGSTPDGQNIVTLNVVFRSLEITHSGYKNSSIDFRIPYHLELLDSAGQVLALKNGRGYMSFDNDASAEQVATWIDDFISRIADREVDELLLEWQPATPLKNVYPYKENGRTIIGVRTSEWITVDSQQPRLEWESASGKFTEAQWAEVTDLSYEVEIFGYEPYAPSFPAQRRTIKSVRGLESPQYLVDESLLPCQRYYWKPKARFRYRSIQHTVSAPEDFVLLTPGPDCRDQRWTLPLAYADLSQ